MLRTLLQVSGIVSMSHPRQLMLIYKKIRCILETLLYHGILFNSLKVLYLKFESLEVRDEWLGKDESIKKTILLLIL